MKSLCFQEFDALLSNYFNIAFITFLIFVLFQGHNDLGHIMSTFLTVFTSTVLLIYKLLNRLLNLSPLSTNGTS